MLSLNIFIAVQSVMLLHTGEDSLTNQQSAAFPHHLAALCKGKAAGGSFAGIELSPPLSGSAEIF